MSSFIGDLASGLIGEQRFYGIYSGIVFSNTDLENKGRIMAVVPDVTGTVPSTWAKPCIPFAGKQSGAFLLPEIGSKIWMMYEGGDKDHPVWMGGWWGSTAELPEMGIASPPLTPNVAFQTTGRNSLTIFGTPGGGVMICAGPVASPTSPRITVNQAGILIQAGTASIMVAAAGTVTINNGALVVTP